MRTVSSSTKADLCARIAALLALGVAVVVLLGWQLDVESFKTVVPGLAAMNPVAAVTFFLSGACLYALTLPGRRATSLVNSLATVVFCIGMLKLVSALGHWSLELDTLIFRDKVLKQSWNGNPNQLAPITALSFVTMSSAILLRGTWRRHGALLTQLLLLFQSLFALVALLSYFYGARDLNDFGGYLPMSLPSALTFLVLSFGTVCALPQCGIMQLMVNQGEAGAATQRLMLSGLGAPLFLGWLTLRGQAEGFYSPRVAVAVFCVLATLCFAALTLWHGFTLLQMQIRRIADEQELRESEERFRLLSNSAFEALAIAVDGMIIDVNQEFCRNFGYEYSEVIGMKSVDFVSSDSKSIVAEKIAHNSEQIYHAIGLRKDGSAFDIEVSGRMLPLHGKLGRVTAIRDVTERRRVERMKDEFVSVVNHELRTPLTSIHGALGLIANGMTGPLPTPALEMTGVALRNAKRLLTLINDLLDIQKIEAGEMSFVLSDFDLGHLIQTTLESMEAYGGKLAVSFQADLGDRQVQVHSDPDRLTQVLANLFSNAAKFSPSDGRVTVKMRTQEQQVRIEVHDDGSGIPLEFQPRIFDKFAQADSSATRHAEGTGLGLSICRSIMENLGGSIGFESSEAVGTTFYIQLPLSSTELKSTPMALS